MGARLLRGTRWLVERAVGSLVLIVHRAAVVVPSGQIGTVELQSRLLRGGEQLAPIVVLSLWRTDSQGKPEELICSTGLSVLFIEQVK